MNQNIDQIEAIRRYLPILEKDGYALKDIPKELRCETLCHTAVKQTGYALQYVPESLRFFTICRDAVANNNEALEWVPVKYQIELIRERYNEVLYRLANDKAPLFLIFAILLILSVFVVDLGYWWGLIPSFGLVFWVWFTYSKTKRDVLFRIELEKYKCTEQYEEQKSK